MPSWRRSVTTLLRIAYRADRPAVVAIFALNLAAQFAWLVSILGIKYLLDAAVHRDVTQAVAAALLIVVLGQLSFLCGWKQWDYSVTVTEKTAQRLDEQLMEISGGLPGIEHHERPAYADRITQVRQERRRLGFAAYSIGLNVRIWVQLAGSVALLARLQPLLVLLPLFAFGSFVTQTRAQRLVEAANDDTTGLTRHRRELFDLVTSAPAGKEVRVFGLRDELIGRHREAASTIDGRLNSAARRATLRQAAGRVVFALGYVGAIGLVLDRAVTGHATAGDVALAITLAALINAQVAQAAEEFAYLRRLVDIGKRYVWLLDYAQSAQSIVADPIPVPADPGQGIELRGVSFRYPGTDVAVLDDVSFSVPAGATVALVGENGSGKTTLAKLLLRMYEPDGGTITLDGVDIGRFEVREYRRQLSAAFQDFCRFEFAVREAVGVGDLQRLASEPQTAKDPAAREMLISIWGV